MRWISVEEFLPGANHDLIVCAFDDNQIRLINHHKTNISGTFQYLTKDRVCYVAKVTHWLLLPKLPNVDIEIPDPYSMLEVP